VHRWVLLGVVAEAAGKAKDLRLIAARIRTSILFCVQRMLMLSEALAFFSIAAVQMVWRCYWRARSPGIHWPMTMILSLGILLEGRRHGVEITRLRQQQRDA
jgi:hypothetical protein